MSQLDLAGAAGTTTRHLSFLETGRSRPSHQMVVRLSDSLQIPLRERNRLLEMAGLAAAYPEGDLSDDDLAPFRTVVGRLLDSHDPYPGFVVDRQWNMVQANRGAAAFLAGIEERNTVRLVLGPLRPIIDNWEQVTVELGARVAADLLRYPDDPTLQGLHAAITDAVGSGRPTPPGDRRVICPRFVVDGMTVRTITVAARFESVADVTLDEVRVELIYPEDDTADQFFRDLAEHG
jgi:transcriptional regulator with XRE-family HTH domain